MKKRSEVRLNWMKGISLAILVIGSAVVLSSCGGGKKKDGKEGATEEAGELVEQDWPIFRRDPELQGVSQENLMYPLELAWSFEPEPGKGGRRLPIEASPVVADGTVYVGNQEGRFFAIDLETGEKRWEFEADGPITGAAAVYGARVFVGDTHGIFYALNTEGGVEAWRFEADDKIEGGVNILESDDGVVRIFFGSHDYFLYCLDAGSGDLLWKHETSYYIMATPSLVNSGGQQAVTFGGCDGIFHIVPADGEGEAREIEVGSYIANSSSVRDGIAYVTHNGGEVIAVDIESGEEVWKVSTGQEYRGAAAVGPKRLYVPTPDKTLIAYDRVTGDEVWKFQGRRAFDSSPVLAGEVLWQAGVDGFLYAINPETGEELWNWEVGAKVKSSPAISRGLLVICGDDGSVYAFRSAAGGTPSEPNG